MKRCRVWASERCVGGEEKFNGTCRGDRCALWPGRGHGGRAPPVTRVPNADHSSVVVIFRGNVIVFFITAH